VRYSVAAVLVFGDFAEGGRTGGCLAAASSVPLLDPSWRLLAQVRGRPWWCMPDLVWADSAAGAPARASGGLRMGSAAGVHRGMELAFAGLHQLLARMPDRLNCLDCLEAPTGAAS